MNVIDVVLLLVLLLAIWAGWMKGFILGVVDLLIWIGCILIAFLIYKYPSEFFP